MSLLFALACLLVGSLAVTQQEQKCKTRPYLVGVLTISTDDDWQRLYYYDTELQRMAIFKLRNSTELSVTYEYLLNFREGVMYDIGGLRCVKRPLKTDYRPIGIPDDASLIGTVNMAGGVYSVWEGLTSGAELYKMTVIGPECLPLMTTYNTTEYGEVSFVFTNHELKVAPLSRPWFCPDLDASPEGSPVDFLSLFLKSDTWQFMKSK